MAYVVAGQEVETTGPTTPKSGILRDKSHVEGDNLKK